MDSAYICPVNWLISPNFILQTTVKTSSLFSAALTGLALFANPAHGAQLYQNGQFLSALGAGYGGADVSVVQDPASSSGSSSSF